jgi:hypothetical protein
MSLYPESIARCQHIKVNGIQCASPAVRARRFCYFHNQFRQKQLQINSNLQQQRWKVKLPLLEDANSIQMGLVQVMRLLVTQQIDHRTAALMLYALQTASANLKHTLFEPEPTRVVIDRKSVNRRPLGVSAWSTVEGVEYDDLAECINQAQQDDVPQKLGDGSFDQMLAAVIAKAAINTGYRKRQGMARSIGWASRSSST